LQRLDRNAFEIFLYHDHFVEDSTSARLRGLAGQWRNFIGQSTDAVEQLLRTDRPDILIDLSGHSGLNRMPVFARRIAPVQIAYLGYPNTTGLKTMDFRFTDAVADPAPESDGLHTEKLIRFSNVAWTYSPAHDAPAVQLPQSRNGRPLTFGSFNNASKVNAFTLRLWADVLRASPGSQLMMKSFGLDAEQMAPRLAGAGIDPARVLVVPATASVAEHLACYHRVDIALDPFPYHGTTTTCEALWMGVPVVTLRGDRHASRVGASLLSAIGHPEWIANEPETYVKIAATLASNPEQLADERQNLRPAMERSLLLSHAAQAASFGRALRACWQTVCS
jgi:protein O-GlcNAc transferase